MPEITKTDLQEAIDKLSISTKNLIDTLNSLLKFNRNKFYMKKYDQIRTDFHKNAKSLELLFHKYGKLEEEAKISDVIKEIVMKEADYTGKLTFLENFQKFLIDIEISVGSVSMKSFEVPPTIPYNEVRLDLEEAIKNYDSGCYLSAQVMCRRAFEGALKEKYKDLEGADPKENLVCQHCKKIIRPNADFSVSKLHKWAEGKNLIHERFQNIGLLIPDLGAGGAHPLDKPVPRDKQVSKLTIEATFTLLNLIYSKSK